MHGISGRLIGIGRSVERENVTITSWWQKAGNIYELSPEKGGT